MEKLGQIVPRLTSRKMFVEGTVAHVPVEYDLDADESNGESELVVPTLITTRKPINRKAPDMQAPHCALCHDAGYLRVDVQPGHPQFGKPVPCTCKRAEIKTKRQQELIVTSGILGLDEFEHASFDDFDIVTGVRPALGKAQDFAERPSGWLVFTGPCGCGKTHLAVSIARQRVEAGDTVLVQTVPDLLDYLRASFNPKSEQQFDARFHEMREVDLLVLDDLGTQQTTTWAAEKLFQLLNHRYNRRLPTVITTNDIHLTSIDERIRSRLGQKRLVSIVKMDKASDYRPSAEQEGEE